MNKSDLYFNPRQEVIRAISLPAGEPEMTEFESAFLCGLIKERKPKKILEVGIAAGGTTAIILQCLDLLHLSNTTELYSVDSSELFYRGDGEKSGYLADALKRKTDSEFKHTVLLGNILPSVINSIGGNIDFVILDTTHVLPGEILDFITVYPYLTKDACIVLHDIANNHYGNYLSAYCTQLLLDSVVAERIIIYDDSRPYKYPNIGAFIINEDTKKYIRNIFHSLMLTWDYIPNEIVLKEYCLSWEQHYNSQHIELFHLICQMQINTQEKHSHEQKQVSPQQDWRHSNSYKIGRIITYIPRHIKQLINGIL